MSKNEPEIACIIGAQRCGSTWLDQILNDHPEIEMFRPLTPERKLFMDPDTKGWEKDRYVASFYNANLETKWVGEKATSYLEYPDVAKRIHSMSSTAMVFCILRHPIARAISHYHFSRSNGLENRTMEEVFIEGKIAPPYEAFVSVDPFAYIARGNYAKYLIPFKKVFGDRLNIVIFEEVVGNLGQIQGLYKQLGVNANHIPMALNKIVNSTETSKELCPDHIYKVLKDAVSEYVGSMENFIGRSIPAWHD